MEEALTNDLFVPEGNFEDLVLEAAGNNTPVGKLLRELQETSSAGQVCVPWLGETSMKERILRLCAHGKVSINLRGMAYLQIQAGEDEETAWKRLRPETLVHTGRQLDEIFLLLLRPCPLQVGLGAGCNHLPMRQTGSSAIDRFCRPRVPLVQDKPPTAGGIFGVAHLFHGPACVCRIRRRRPSI